MHNQGLLLDIFESLLKKDSIEEKQIVYSILEWSIQYIHHAMVFTTRRGRGRRIDKKYTNKGGRQHYKTQCISKNHFNLHKGNSRGDTEEEIDLLQIHYSAMSIIFKSCNLASFLQLLIQIRDLQGSVIFF